MEQNIFYKAMYSRRRELSKIVVGVLISLSSWPKLVLEVFLRKNLGERIFTLRLAILIGLILFFLPIYYPTNRFYPWTYVVMVNWTYYLFLIGYAIMSYFRHLEVKRGPSVYDLEKFTLSPGEPRQFFDKLKINGEPIDLRYLELYIEPGIFFLAGIPLFLMYQFTTAILLFVCSLAYYISNLVAHIQGDHFVMDLLDQIIVNREVSGTFARNENVSPSGIPCSMKKPKTADLRKKLADFMDEASEAR